VTLLSRLATRIFPLGIKRGQGPLVPIAQRLAWSTPLVVLLGSVASLSEGIGISLLIPLMSQLTGGALPRALPGAIREVVELLEPCAVETRLLIIGGAIVALIAFKGIVQFANAALIAWIDTRVFHQVRTALAKKVVTLDYPFFLIHDQARLVKIVTADTWYGLEVVRCGFQLLTGAAAVTVFGALMLWLDWQLFLTVVVAIVAIRVLQNQLEGRVSRLGETFTREYETLTARMLAVISAYRPIRIFQQQDNELARFTQASDRVRRALELIERWSALARPLVEVLLSVLFVVLIVFSYRTGWSIAIVPTFLILLYRVQPQLATINSSRLRIAAVEGSLRQIEWLLAQAGPTRLEMPVRPLPAIDRPIVFDSVTYGYPNGTVGLTNATFEIRPGTVTALIGRSGAGKSTVVSLLCRLLEPQTGTIRHGETPLAVVARESWLARIALAGQDVDLVGGTVAFNIAYGRPDASHEEIEDAARAANAHEFILGLPKGYQTLVGDDGLRLSGGQRQRIGLARALLRRPDLLILDEAMSAVDAISESEIMRLLSSRQHFRTALVISHRRSTLMACERGIVLEEGRVREQGPLARLAYSQGMTE
jgi:ATP-binding cassette, subfamily B, bacterial MsbA